MQVDAGPALDRLLRDRDGEAHASSVGPGRVPDALLQELHAAADRELHPDFARLVQATPQPFLQAIVDLAVPRMAFGRTCLLGDAAFVVRPHTAAATAKAAADATALAREVEAAAADVSAALAAYAAARLAAGRDLVAYGQALGRRSVTGAA